MRGTGGVGGSRTEEPQGRRFGLSVRARPSNTAARELMGDEVRIEAVPSSPRETDARKAKAGVLDAR